MITYGIARRAPDDSSKLSSGALFQSTAFGLNIFLSGAFKARL
jgi:hypothetical protein